MAMQPSTALAERLWEADLAHQRACQEVWATGVDLLAGSRLAQALALNHELIEIDTELRRRAGSIALRDLRRLVRDAELWPDSAERIHAAATLRVLDSDTFVDAAEGLQPGAELPAVGIYADLD